MEEIVQNQGQLIVNLEKKNQELQESIRRIIGDRATEKTMSGNTPFLGNMDPYVDGKDWSQWQDRLEQFFIVNGIEDGKKFRF